jgi:hypothetical protein
MDPRNYGPGGYDPADYRAAGGPGLGDYGPGYGPMLPAPADYGPGSIAIGGPMMEPAAGHVGHGPKDYTRPDARILEDVCEKLTLDPVIDAREVSVEVEDGVVRTSGTVESRQIKRMVEDIALTVWGVKDVDDQIQIAPADQE